MAGSITSLNNGITSASVSQNRSGSDRLLSREVGDLGKHLAANDVAAAQSAVAALKTAAPTQNAGTDFSNAVKALDAALKANNTSGAAEAFANLQRAQKRIQQDRLTGPAQDVPNRPRVSGGADFETVRAPQAVAAPERATGAETAQLAKTSQAETQRTSNEQAFITRQDLAAKAAQATPPTQDAKQQIGATINTTA